MKLDTITPRKAGCLVIKRNEILLVRKGEKWELPKGSIKHGESAIGAAIRETKEETGILVKVISKFPKTCEETVFYPAKPKSGSIKPGDGEGILECKWLDVKDALTKIIPEHMGVLKHFL